MKLRVALALAAALALAPVPARSETATQAAVHASVNRQYSRLVLGAARPDFRARIVPAVQAVLRAATGSHAAPSTADLMAVAQAELAKLASPPSTASTPGNPNAGPSPSGGVLGGSTFSGADIEAACFIVLMAATNAAENDLKDVMAATKALAAAKACGRSVPCIRQLRPTTEYSAAALQNAIAAWGAGQGAIDAASEMAALRTQMVQGRLAKLMETLSNVLKKLEDTGSTVVQNLK